MYLLNEYRKSIIAKQRNLEERWLEAIAKKKKEVSLEVIGGNSEGVTGSCTKIDFFGRTILFELGMIQDNSTILENYKANSAILNKIKSKSIEMVIVGHLHCDHIALIPMLFARGNTQARIIEIGRAHV